MASELKPCPFCGSDARMWPSHTKADKNGSYEIVGCSNIDCFIEPTTDEYLPYEEAVQRWNTRPAPAATDTGLVTVGVTGVMPGSSGGFTQVVFRADDVPANVAVCLRSQAVELLAAERAEHDNTIATLTSLITDNAAKDADLDRVLADNRRCLVRINGLEAKLAAANEVAQRVIQAEEDKSGDPNFYILLMQTAYDKARAVLGGKPL